MSISFSSLRKSYTRVAYVLEVGNFDGDIVRRTTCMTGVSTHGTTIPQFCLEKKITTQEVLDHIKNNNYYNKYL